MSPSLYLILPGPARAQLLGTRRLVDSESEAPTRAWSRMTRLSLRLRVGCHDGIVTVPVAVASHGPGPRRATLMSESLALALGPWLLTFFLESIFTD